MELAARQSSPQRLDRMRLTEDVTERHGVVVERSRSRGKRMLFVLGISLIACAAEPPKRVAAPEPEPSPAASYTYAPPTGPIEDAKRALAASASEKDPHERCRLLNEAALLDPSLLEARRARAESRCVPAVELLPDAKFVFTTKRDVDGAKLFKDIATRADDALAMREAADALVELQDFYDAAAVWVSLGEHARAAAAFGEVAKNRAAKGAAVDALDARLSAVIERARSKTSVVAALDALVEEATEAKKSYGAAWIGPKFLEALAAARNAGDETRALVQKAQKRGLFVGAEDMFEIERAIAAARSGKVDLAVVLKMRARLMEPAVRALLAVTAKSCADRKAHARAHAFLGDAALRLDDDVEWARNSCNDTAVVRTTMVPPKDPADVADAAGIVDPPRKRLRILALTKARPDDVSAAAWGILIADYSPPGSMQNEPSIQDALLMRHTASSLGKPSSARARALTQALLTAIEADIPRAIAARIAQALELARTLTVDTKPGWEDVATALMKECGAGLPGPCLAGPSAATLRRATEILRGPRPFALATHGPKLSKEDFADVRVRLDVILALITWEKNVKQATLLRGPSYGPFTGAEASLASAAIAAAAGNCTAARALLKEAGPLQPEYPDAWAYLEKTCKSS